MNQDHVETLIRIDENVKYLKEKHSLLDNKHKDLEVRQSKLEKKWWVIVGSMIVGVAGAIKSFITGH